MVGVNSEIVKRMLKPGADLRPTPAGGRAQDIDPNRLPGIRDELGLFTRTAGNITQVKPEVVSWKVSGKLLAVASRGLAGDHPRSASPILGHEIRLSQKGTAYRLQLPEGSQVDWQAADNLKRTPSVWIACRVKGGYSAAEPLRAGGSIPR